MNCQRAIWLIHELLDEEITSLDEQELKEHLELCPACTNHFHSLKETVVILKSSSHFYAPHGFTNRVMVRLPHETRTQLWRKKLQKHPILVAASLFVLFMAGSAVSLWSEDKQFQLSAYQPQKLEIDKTHNEVIVPADRVVDGDIIVHNADIKVAGKVKGNVVAIDGHIYLASTGSVAGEKEEIHEMVEWVWYNIKTTVQQLAR